MMLDFCFFFLIFPKIRSESFSHFQNLYWLLCFFLWIVRVSLLLVWYQLYLMVVILVVQVSQLGAAAQKYQAATQNAPTNLSAPELQNNCNLYVSLLLCLFLIEWSILSVLFGCWIDVSLPSFFFFFQSVHAMCVPLAHDLGICAVSVTYSRTLSFGQNIFFSFFQFHLLCLIHIILLVKSRQHICSFKNIYRLKPVLFLLE